VNGGTVFVLTVRVDTFEVRCYQRYCEKLRCRNGSGEIESGAIVRTVLRRESYSSFLCCVGVLC